MTEGGTYADTALAKKVHIYSNGDKFFGGRRFVINPRTTRNFDSFLTQVTTSLKPAFGAVRTLRTPDNGHPVGDLNDLETGRSYVACAQKFIKLGYNDISFAQRPRNQPSPQRRSKLIVSGRIKKIERFPIAIYVYTNGEALEPARRVLLKPWVQKTWENVLVAVNEKVNLRSGAVRHLIELNSKSEVTEGVQLKNNEFYVAVGSERYKNLDYGAQPLILSPRQQQKKRYPSLAPLKKKSNRSNTNTEASSGASSSSNQSSLENSTNSSNADQITSKPRKKAAVQQPAKEEGIPVKPIKHKRGSGDKSKQEETKPQKPESDRKRPPKKEAQKEIDLDKDDSGVYKSRGKKQKAAEVKEDKRTKTEVPIDKREAEEVEDETVEYEDNSHAAEPSPIAKTKPEAENRSQPKSNKTQASSPQQSQKSNTPPKDRSPSPSSQNEISTLTDKTLTPEPIEGSTVNEESTEAEQSAPSDENAAATKIQARYRGYRTRKNLAAERENNEKELEKETNETAEGVSPEVKTAEKEPDLKADEAVSDAEREAAAIKIQASFRGYQVRKDLKMGENEEKLLEQKSPVPSDDEKAQNDAATKIQANYRGYKTRRELRSQNAADESDSVAKGEEKQSGESGAQPTPDDEKEEGGTGENRDAEYETAAVKIQSNYRGYRTRKQNPATKINTKHILNQMAQKGSQSVKSLSAMIENEYIARPQVSHPSFSETSSLKQFREAASLIQATFREYVQRKKLANKSRYIAENSGLWFPGHSLLDLVSENEFRDVMAIKEQQAFRQYVQRKSLNGLIDKREMQLEESVRHSEHDDFAVPVNVSTASVIKIQALYRGYKVRQSLHKTWYPMLLNQRKNSISLSNLYLNGKFTTSTLCIQSYNTNAAAYLDADDPSDADEVNKEKKDNSKDENDQTTSTKTQEGAVVTSTSNNRNSSSSAYNRSRIVENDLPVNNGSDANSNSLDTVALEDLTQHGHEQSQQTSLVHFRIPVGTGSDSSSDEDGESYKEVGISEPESSDVEQLALHANVRFNQISLEGAYERSSIVVHDHDIPDPFEFTEEPEPSLLE